MKSPFASPVQGSPAPLPSAADLATRVRGALTDPPLHNSGTFLAAVDKALRCAVQNLVEEVRQNAITSVLAGKDPDLSQLSNARLQFTIIDSRQPGPESTVERDYAVVYHTKKHLRAQGFADVEVRASIGQSVYSLTHTAECTVIFPHEQIKALEEMLNTRDRSSPRVNHRLVDSMLACLDEHLRRQIDVAVDAAREAQMKASIAGQPLNVFSIPPAHVELSVRLEHLTGRHLQMSEDFPAIRVAMLEMADRIRTFVGDVNAEVAVNNGMLTIKFDIPLATPVSSLAPLELAELIMSMSAADPSAILALAPSCTTKQERMRWFAKRLHPDHHTGDAIFSNAMAIISRAFHSGGE